jgi:sulfur transfer protein SufE
MKELKNERIKELIEQCRIQEYDMYGNLIEIGTDAEELTKLVVKECLNKIYLEAAQYAEPVWAFELINDIKEHFGVKE